MINLDSDVCVSLASLSFFRLFLLTRPQPDYALIGSLLFAIIGILVNPMFGSLVGPGSWRAQVTPDCIGFPSHPMVKSQVCSSDPGTTILQCLIENNGMGFGSDLLGQSALFAHTTLDNNAGENCFTLIPA